MYKFWPTLWEGGTCIICKYNTWPRINKGEMLPDAGLCGAVKNQKNTPMPMMTMLMLLFFSCYLFTQYTNKKGSEDALKLITKWLLAFNSHLRTRNLTRSAKVPPDLLGRANSNSSPPCEANHTGIPQDGLGPYSKAPRRRL